MGFFRWTLLGVMGVASWMAAVALGGAVGGTEGAIGWGLMVYPWLGLSGGAYWLARRSARREEGDGTLFLRRCLDCGRPVTEGVGICPDQACDGVEFGYQWDVHRRDAGYRAREDEAAAERADRETERRMEELRGVGLAAARPYVMVVGWYARGFLGRASYAAEAEQLLWWSSRMLAIGGVFGALVMNATSGPSGWGAGGGVLEGLMGWGRMVMVLGGALALSAFIAVSGPGSQRARLREAEVREREREARLRAAQAGV